MVPAIRRDCRPDTEYGCPLGQPCVFLRRYPEGTALSISYLQ